MICKKKNIIIMSKTIIVTGSSGNMGQAVVKKFIDEGDKVVGTIIHNDKKPMNFSQNNFEKVIVDVMNEESSQKFVDDIVLKYGTVDVAVLTVGGFATGSIAETKTSDIFKQYQLNFETAYNIARPVFIQMMKQDSGRIFLIGARPGLNTANGKGMIAYSLSKSLIFNLAELMNKEAKGKNIVTNVIVPGTIDTPQNRKSMPDADFNNWVQPSQIADVIYYYSGNEAAVLRESVIKVYNNS